MQKLHLVGFTPELDGLILSTRKGAKSGSFVVKVDPGVLQQLGESSGASGGGSRANGRSAPREPRAERPESDLGPREMQELLRRGWTVEEVAKQAGVDLDWVGRFASPVLAEISRVLDFARRQVFDKPRVGESSLPLAPSVRRNVADRGIRFTDEEFDAAWRAHQLDDLLWVVGFDYRSRGKPQSAEWTVDLETGELSPRGRLGTQLGHVEGRRRAARAAAAPAKKTAAKNSTGVATSNRARSRQKQQPAKRSSGAAKKKKSGGAGPARSAPQARPAVAVEPSSSRPQDPYREELRRRGAEQAEPATTERGTPPSPRRPAPRREPEPDLVFEDDEPEPTPEPERTPHVVVIGPTVRALERRPARRAEPPPPAEPPPAEPPPAEPPPAEPPPRRRSRRRQAAPEPEPEPVTGPPPAVRDELPGLEWSPGRKGPLPAPEPAPVPEDVRERVSSPLGGVEDDDELDAEHWFPPPRTGPTFTGATAAGETPRRRRSEPLRGR